MSLQKREAADRVGGWRREEVEETACGGGPGRGFPRRRRGSDPLRTRTHGSPGSGSPLPAASRPRSPPTPALHNRPLSLTWLQRRSRATPGLERGEVLNGELEDLRLFQLLAPLALEGGRDEASELRQRRVDPVPPPLLDHLPCHQFNSRFLVPPGGHHEKVWLVGPVSST